MNNTIISKILSAGIHVDVVTPKQTLSGRLSKVGADGVFLYAKIDYYIPWNSIKDITVPEYCISDVQSLFKSLSYAPTNSKRWLKDLRGYSQDQPKVIVGYQYLDHTVIYNDEGSINHIESYEF